MNTQFKRHQKVKLLSDPAERDIEYYTEKPQKIKAGTIGTVNILLPNGRYHIKIESSDGEEIAYVAMDEEQLQAVS